MGEPGSRTGPASFGQEQLWLVEQARPGNTVNHAVRVWELRGPLDVVALRAGLNRLVVDHPALRTTLHPSASGLIQRVGPPRPVPLDEVDLPAAASDEAVLRADPAIHRLLTEPFDLGADLMIKAVLGRIAPQHHVLVLNVHHCAGDGHSFAILREDLDAHLAGTALPPSGSDYLTHAADERAAAAGGSPDVVRWLESLRELPVPSGPLTDGVREVTSAATIRQFDLPADECRLLWERAADAAATANMALTALFALVLSRWTGHGKVAFTSPVGTRLMPGYERTVGFFVNSVPLVIDTTGADFDGLLDRVRAEVLSAMGFARVPPGDIRAAAGVRPGGADPLHLVSFAVEHTGAGDFTLGPLTGRDLFLHPGTALFALSVRVDLSRAQPRVTVEHDASVVAPDVVGRFAAHLRETLTALVAGARPADLPAVPAADARLLRRWSRGPRTDPGPDLLSRVARSARHRPDAIAVRAAGTGISYGTLWSAAGRLAAELRSRGIGREDLVGICLPRSGELVVAVLGVLRSGAAFAPLDPRDPPRRRAALLAADRAAGLVTTHKTDVGGHGWTGAVLTVPPSGPAPEPDPVAEPPPEPDALAYVIHTSGTTGTPKSVLVHHRGLTNYLRWAVGAYRLTEDAVVPLHTSVAYDLAVTSLLGPLYAGGRVLVVPEEAGPMATAELPEPVRMIKATPRHMDALTTSMTPGSGPEALVLGGENLAAGQVRRWRRLLPGVRVINEYGPTETVVGSVAHEMGRDPAAGAVPIGTPIDNTTVSVVDERLVPVPIGVVGELLIGGAGVARGYLGSPARTAGRFVPDPLEPGARAYRTGDLARWLPSGELDLLGRVDDQVKILGYRVEPGEVEAVLAAAPGVRAAAVVPDRRDPAAVRLVGFVSITSPTAPDEVRAYVRARLPGHLVPGELVVVGELPMAANGKVDRTALPLPDRDVTVAAPAPGDGDSRWQQAVATAWCRILGVDRVPAGATFFEAGGTSLMLIALEGELRAQGAHGLTVTDLFRYSTVQRLAARIALLNKEGDHHAPAPLRPLKPAIRRSVIELRGRTP